MLSRGRQMGPPRGPPQGKGQGLRGLVGSHPPSGATRSSVTTGELVICPRHTATW